MVMQFSSNPETLENLQKGNEQLADITAKDIISSMGPDDYLNAVTNIITSKDPKASLNALSNEVNAPEISQIEQQIEEARATAQEMSGNVVSTEQEKLTAIAAAKAEAEKIGTELGLSLSNEDELTVSSNAPEKSGGRSV